MSAWRIAHIVCINGMYSSMAIRHVIINHLIYALIITYV